MSDKIVKVHDLANMLEERGHRKVVLCHGVFDLLHIGHIRHFRQAREHGDILVVTLSPDRFVDKGPYRPAFDQGIRAEAVASVDCVDYVAVSEWPTAEDLLRLLRPDFYAKGAEFRDLAKDRVGKIAGELAVLEEIKAEMVFTEDIVYSSSALINRHLSNLPDELHEYMKLFRKRYGLDHILKVLDRMGSLRVLVLGETIVDEYHYCDAIGKSSKDPILAIKHVSDESFAGGAAALANHLAGFVDSVRFVSVLGGRDDREDMVAGSLSPNVTPCFFRQQDGPTIIKRRFIDRYFLQKLMEVYVMDESGLDQEEDARMRDHVSRLFDDCDLVLVADYGHGAISPAMVDLLCAKAPYLAVNTQANAGNRGFHAISRYGRADYISLALHELELEFRGKALDIHPAMDELAGRMGCKVLSVTTGAKGCAVWKAPGEFAKVPAFATRTVDRVGSGDAFLSLAALAGYLGADNEVVGFFGNVAGALAVETVGNKSPVDKKRLESFITALLK